MTEARPEMPVRANTQLRPAKLAACLMATIAGLGATASYAQSAGPCGHPGVRKTVISIAQDQYRKIEGRDDQLIEAVQEAISAYVAKQIGQPFLSDTDWNLFIAGNEAVADAASAALTNPAIDLIGIEQLTQGQSSGAAECRGRLILDVAFPAQPLSVHADKFNRATQQSEPYPFVVKPKAIHIDGYQIPIQYLIRPKDGQTQILVYGLPQ